MKVVLVNLSNKAFEASRKRLNDSAKKFGVDKVISYDFEAIKSTQFYQANRPILGQPKGMGYWLWKPFIISEVLNSIDEGEILIYADSGMTIVGDLKPLIDLCTNERPVLLFANGNLKNAAWTKRDCFVLMHCDSEPYWNGPQVDAAFCVFRKSAFSIELLSTWLTYSCDPRIITDAANTTGLDDRPGFVAHRHDQSILSLLAIRYGLELYRMPSQFGNHYKMPGFRVRGELNCENQLRRKQLWKYAEQYFSNSPYYQLLDHHRSNTGQPTSANKGLKEWLSGRIENLKRFIQKIIPVS